MNDFLTRIFRTGLAATQQNIAKLRREISRGRHSPVLHEILGRLHAGRKEYDEACVQWRECIRRSSRKNPLGIAALRELIGDTLLLLGRDREAGREYRRAVRFFERGRKEAVARIIKDDATVRQARCLVRLGKPDEATRLLNRVRRGPNGAVFDDELRVLIREFQGVGTFEQVPPASECDSQPGRCPGHTRRTTRPR